MARITKKQALKKLNAAAREAGELQSKADELQGEGVDNKRFIQWRNDTRAHIEDIFTTDSHHFRDFERIKYSPRMQPNAPDEVRQRWYVGGLKKAQALLQSMVSKIRADWPDDSVPLLRWAVIITVAGAIVTIIVGIGPIVDYVQRLFPR